MNLISTNVIRIIGLIILAGAMIPVNYAYSNILPDADGKDDSAIIVERIKESLPKGGLISVEQYTGRLLFNPVVDQMHLMALKKKFLLPAIIVNQSNGLKLVSEVPLACFMLSAGQLASNDYKSFRQHQTLQYIRNVKNFPVSRALICSPLGNTGKNWQSALSLPTDADQFIFQEHVSLTGEHFFYFLNTDGSFEMYM